MTYLDHAATSLPRWPKAIAAASEAADLGSPGRGMHALQAKSSAAVEATRAAIAESVFQGTVCFTSGATHGLNQAIAGLRPRPRRIAIGPMLHNAARRPVAHTKCPIWPLPADINGRIDVMRARKQWPSDVDLVVLSHGSNVTGLLQPVAELAELARANRVHVVVDAAQTAGIIQPLDLGPVDAVAFSAHKGFRALPGCGALIVAADFELTPLMQGGTGFDATAHEMPSSLPARLEPGTLNLPGIAALGAAVICGSQSPWNWQQTAQALREAVHAAGVPLVGSGELPVVSFTLPGLSPTAIEEMLDRSWGITVRAGLHCASEAHRTLDTHHRGTVRCSAGATTTSHDLNELTRALRQLKQVVGMA